MLQLLKAQKTVLNFIKYSVDINIIEAQMRKKIQVIQMLGMKRH